MNTILKIGYFSLFFIFLATSCVTTKKDKEETSALCGNSIIDPGEQCDDGNIVDHDGCSALCEIESFCGNGVVEPGEECDDENFENGDGCSRDCMVEKGCGDGVLQVGEECDDDNIDDGDGCDHYCKLEGSPVCGNGIHEYTEGCDDGNTDNGDGCDSNCMKEDGCGDGTKTETEQCDDGNTIVGDGCSDICQVEFICGNDTCSEDQGENCELCPSDCCKTCGDGILDPDEGCDDGNNTSGDGCSRGCSDEDSVAVCGNGLWELGEECDDGNQTVHDGCSDVCVKEYVCGDNLCTSNEGETCENCGQDCCPACGNGVRQPGETCDTDDLNNKTCAMFGYDGGNLACTSSCSFDFSSCTGSGPICGNGIKEYGEDCDGSDMNNSDCLSLGFLGGLAFCDGTCHFNTSGCSDQVRWFYETFDDNLPPQGWTFSYPFEWGTPANNTPAPFSGSSCIGTSMGGNVPDNADYDINYVITPAIDLSNATSPVLYFWGWMDMEDSTYDNDEWKIEYSLDGVSWSPVTDTDPPYNNNGSFNMYDGANSWAPYVANVQSLGGQSTVYFRISVQFDHYSDFLGLYIDDVMVVEGAQIPITLTTPTELGKAVTNHPFSRALDVWGGSGDINYSVVGTIPGWLNLDSSTGVLSGTPLITDLGSFTITILATDNQNPLNTNQKDFNIDVLDAIYYEDFEGGSLPSGWTIGGSVFEYGSPAGNGPSTCPSGTHCVGTDFSADYTASMAWTNCVTTGDIDLNSASAAQLTFKGYRDTETNYDGAICEVTTNGGTSWDDSSTRSPAYNEDNGNRMTWSGHDAVWEDFEVDLNPYIGHTVKIRWCFYSDSSVQNPGWYFDDVMILGN